MVMFLETFKLFQSKENRIINTEGWLELLKHQVLQNKLLHEICFPRMT